MSNIPANALDHFAAALGFLKQDIEDTIQQNLNTLRNQVLQDIRQEIYAHEKLVKELLRKPVPVPQMPAGLKKMPEYSTRMAYAPQVTLPKAKAGAKKRRGARA